MITAKQSYHHHHHHYHQVNLDGVLHGAKLYAEKQSIESGGSGGLVINTASLAGILYGMDKNR